MSEEKEYVLKKDPKPPFFFRICRFFVKLFTKKYKFEFREEMKKEGCIIVSNHAQAGGPLSYYLYYGKERSRRIWCIGEVINKKEFPDYAMKDFWPNKKSKRFYRFISKLIAPIMQYAFTHANVIPVYKDSRYLTTAKKTVQTMGEGYDIVIFPEEHKPFNEIVYEFQQNFVSVAKLYCAKYKKPVYFYPSYVCPSLKKVVIGKPIEYNPDSNFEEEKVRICEYLKKEITEIAYSLPKHTVIPYENIKKKNYTRT